MKSILICIAIITLLVLILILTIQIYSRKLKSKEKQIDDLNIEIAKKQSEISLITEELKIEKKHKKELAKKLADISSMSIDDVLKQLCNKKG